MKMIYSSIKERKSNVIKIQKCKILESINEIISKSQKIIETIYKKKDSYMRKKLHKNASKLIKLLK